MSEGGFDYEAHRRAAAGSNPDKALLVSFEYASEKQKSGLFENVEMIRIWMDKNTEVVRKVTESDKTRFAERYAAFKAGEEMPEEGTPIRLCAFATPADVSACKAERIFTVEQLVETPDERLARARLINFKYMARDYLEAQKRTGYVGELREKIQQLEAQVEMLKERAGKDEVVETPKKRGRPKKVSDGDTDRSDQHSPA
jgi:hypothetical protein